MKLLQRTIRGYLLYSICILLIAVPVFFITIQRIMRHEIDEELITTKYHLRPKLAQVLDSAATTAVNFLDDHLSITPSSSLKESDTLYSIKFFDSADSELVPYRVIESNIIVNGRPFLLKRRTSLMENEDLITTILFVIITLLILLLGGLFMINRKLSLKVWAPFYQTLDKLRGYRVEENAALELAPSSITEFNDLNKSLETLAERSHHAFISQKEFTENASHEMQTPLAILQSKLELLMQTNPLNEEQAGLIDGLADASQRMQRLNKSLVLLTRIENHQFPETENISVKQIVRHFISQYDAQLEEKNISVQFSEEHELNFSANKILIEILIGNLLGNAIRHNVSNGKINIDLQPAYFEISNTGKNIPMDEQMLFTRFKKESDDSNSIGLGLAISKEICDIYHLKLSYHFSENLHRFRVSF